MHERLAAVRRGSVALRRGGLRWLAVADHALTFERESPDGSERVLVHVARAPHEPVELPGWWFTDAELLAGRALPARCASGTAGCLPAEGPGGAHLAGALSMARRRTPALRVPHG